MRAAQRNNYKCAEFLLNETASELNGSLFSTYTPLWFGVSNGYTELVKLLLDYNANPSINDQHKKPKNQTPTGSRSNNNINTSFDRTDRQQRRDNENSSFLFSPIRASIVYSQFTIMKYLLEYGANVNELFSIVAKPMGTSECFDAVSNDNYVNSLKFFHRQFGHVVKTNESSPFLVVLNEFVQNQNVYRRMLIEFVKNVYTNIRLRENSSISIYIPLF